MKLLWFHCALCVDWLLSPKHIEATVNGEGEKARRQAHPPNDRCSVNAV